VTLESLIDAYGYWAILVGTFFEGETILVLGAFAASRGYLALPWVILVAFIGTLCGDQLFFFLGRKHSEALFARRPWWKVRADKAQGLLERFRAPLIFSFRFMYGLRTVMPFAIGMSTVLTRQFIFLNIIGALVWALVVGTGGYYFGYALEIMLGDIKHYELYILGAVATAGALIWTIYLLYRSRKQRLSSA
jgi:membrane protein DedA with SNARE-associated domain